MTLVISPDLVSRYVAQTSPTLYIPFKEWLKLHDFHYKENKYLNLEIWHNIKKNVECRFTNWEYETQYIDVDYMLWQKRK